MQKQIAKDITIKKLDKSQVEITGSIKAEDFSVFRKKALQNINDEVSIDGFRKGKVPENILVTKVGDMAILEEMAELALSKVYPEIVMSEKIDAIGRPEISITKLAANNPLEFKIVTTVVPEIKLADYKKIAKEEGKKVVEVVEVTDKDVDEALERIKKSHENHEGHDHDSPEAKEQLKNYLIEDRKVKAQEKKRIALSDKLIEDSKIEIPDILVDSELRRTEAQFADDIERMGVKLEDYLKHAKKTIEEIRTEWRPHAEKKAKLQLILNEISKLEKIAPDAQEIEAEVNHIVSHYKDADRERAAIYAETVLTNEKVYSFLESQK